MTPAVYEAVKKAREALIFLSEEDRVTALYEIGLCQGCGKDLFITNLQGESVLRICYCANDE